MSKSIFILSLLSVVLFAFKCSTKPLNNNYEEYYYNENGDSTLHVKCQGDKVYECWEYYRNTQLKSHAKYDGDRLTNIFEVYDTSGALLDFGNFKDGNGFVKCYNNNGELESTGEFRDGMRQGWWVNYHFSGEVIDSVFYDDGIIVGKNALIIPNNKY